MVIVVVAFTESKKSQQQRIARATAGRVRLPADGMAGGIDKEGAMLKNNYFGDPANEKTTERADPAVPESAEERWQNEANQDSKKMDVAMLPQDKRILL